jgi:hypothetical protein
MEELIGDLAEQFGTGRSQLWYWRQATAVLAQALWRALREHGVSFAAAVLVGYALTELWLLGNSHVFRSLYRSLDAAPHPLSQAMLLRFLGLRAAQASLTVLIFIAGWIVTRIHRTHQRAVVLVFVAAVIAQRLLGLANLIANIIDGSQAASLLIPQIVQTALQGVFTFVAGLWVIQKEPFLDMDSQTRRAAVLTLVLTIGSSLLYDAWRVGALAYPPVERYPVDAAEIASGAYLALLLWRRGSRQTAPAGPSLIGGSRI